MMSRLKELTLAGFKSIRRLERFSPGNLAVLIGANGAGKSNLISFFRALGHMMSSPVGLQTHLTQTGKAHSWLHDGPAVTNSVEASLEIESDKGTNHYEFSLEYAAGDSLYFNYERFRFLPKGAKPDPKTNLGSGHVESKLRERAEKGEKTPATIAKMLRRFAVHQFHNTSFTSRMRQAWDVKEGRWLKEDAGNLGVFLHRLKNEQTLAPYYSRIVETIRQGLPFFADFELSVSSGQQVSLMWREVDTDQVFAAHQASDGMLRYMALAALLLQPAQDIPDLLILDEPELGLHPQALATVAGLVKSIATSKQVILATQSVPLVNQFEPADVVVVDRCGRESVFTRLDDTALQDWLTQYTLGELWEKNVIGGRPI